MSRHVIGLEELLGKQLFDRDSSKLVLTVAGEELLPVVSKCLDRLEQTMNAIREDSVSSRVLRIHIPPSLLQQLFIPMLKDFRVEHPEIRIDVSTSDLTGIRIALRPPEPIQGIVKLDEGETSLTSMRIQLEPLAQSQGGPGTMGSGIKEDGKFTVPNLAPSRYRMRIQNIPTGFYLKAIRQGNQDVHLTGLDTTTAGDLTVLLAPGPGSVEGLVKDSKDQPQAQVTVVLVPKDPWQGVADAIRIATSGADGKYQFAQLTPGEYEVFAFEDAETGSWFDPDFRAMYRDQAKTVRVEKSVSSKLDLRPITMQ